MSSLLVMNIRRPLTMMSSSLIREELQLVQGPYREELQLVQGPYRVGAAARVPGGLLGTGDLAGFCHAARGQGSLLSACYVDRAGKRQRGVVARGRPAVEDGVAAMVTEVREDPGRLR